MNLFRSKKLVHFFFAAAIVLVCFALQLLLMPFLAVQGVVPNLLVALIILVALLFSLEFALPLAFLCAFVFKNFLGNDYFFLSWLLAPILALATYPRHLGVGKRTVEIIQVLVCSFYVELFNGFLLSMSHGSEFFLSNYLVLFLAPLMNALLAIPLSFIFQKIFQIDD